MKIDFKKLLPHIAAIGIFLLVAIIFCQPALQGKVVYQHDLQGWRGMVQQSFEFKEKYGHFPLWTNSLFSGMPAYQIALEGTHSVTLLYFDRLVSLGLPQPINFFFVACICFYFLCLVLRINPWVGIMGALAYAYSTYDPVIIMVGHVTKMASIAYAPAVIASFLMILEKKYWSGTALLILFSVVFIAQNHLQIVYYTLLIALAIAVAYTIRAFKEKDILHVAKSGALALFAGLIGLASSSVSLLPTYEFSKDTMRGGRSELTDTTANTANKTKGGLDKDYAFNWSYGVDETLTLAVPGIFGGSSGGELTEKSKTAQALSEQGLPEETAIQIARSLPSYWGPQPSTSGPVYVGALICFLAIFGMFYLDGKHKWWIFAVTVFAIMLSWGGNFKAFNYFIFDFMPGYKKFRAPTMSLVIPQMTLPLLAALALNKLLFGADSKEIILKKLKQASIATAILAGLLIMLYFSFGYSGKNDSMLKENYSQNMLMSLSRGQQPTPQMQAQANEFGQTIVRSLAEDRKAMYGGDLLRSLLFIAAGMALVWLFAKGRVSALIVAIAMLVLVAFDLLPVGKRYLSADNFVEKTNIEDEFTASNADKMIMQDPGYKTSRVFNTDDPFNNAKPSYHFNSVGGYNPAKLAIYQDLIEHQLAKGNMAVFNMLNTKYFVVQDPQSGQQVAQLNNGALGNVWFVKNVQFVANADAEMKALDQFNPKDTAFVDKRYEAKVKGQPGLDSTASIRMLENINDTIRYEYKSATPQFAVFSEVYYDKGWNAYLDGNKTDYVRTDYVLRGMSLPAGNHKIEFRFEPQSYKTGNTIVFWATIVGLLFVIAAVYLGIKKKRLV
ncbi:MAG: YfhO family protein [Ferruginibacter sp.]